MIWYNERFYPGGQLATYLESCGLGKAPTWGLKRNEYASFHIFEDLAQKKSCYTWGVFKMLLSTFVLFSKSIIASSTFSL
jgi:hypothetical protein